MPKFTFICEHETPFKPGVSVAKITYESNREVLDEVIEDFQDFIRGCGYYFDGSLQVVDEELLQRNGIENYDLDQPVTASNAQEAIKLFPEVAYWHNEFYKNNTTGA